MEFEKYYSRSQVAEMLNISVSGVVKIEKTYKVKKHKFGNYVLYDKEDIHRAIEERKKNLKFGGKPKNS